MFPNLPISILILVTGDVEGLIDDTVEEGRGEESGEGERGSGEEDSDGDIQKKEKRKRCEPFTRTFFHDYAVCV